MPALRKGDQALQQLQEALPRQAHLHQPALCLQILHEGVQVEELHGDASIYVSQGGDEGLCRCWLFLRLS